MEFIEKDNLSHLPVFHEPEEWPLSSHTVATAMLVSIFTLSALSAGSEAGDRSDEGTRPAIILEAGEGEAIRFPLHETHRLSSADSNEAGMSFFEIGIPAHSAGAPPHRHTHEDEIFYVREGSVTFMADGNRRTITAGGFVMLPRNGWHAVWNSGEEDAILLVGTSAGRFDDFFDAVAMEVAAAGELSPPEIGAIVGRLGAERGVIIDMSMVPSDVRALYGLPLAGGR